MSSFNLSGEMIVHRKDRENATPYYYTFTSVKKEENKFDNYAIKINFRKGVEIQDKQKIKYSGFLSHDTWEKAGEVEGEKVTERRVKVVVLDYELIEQNYPSNEQTKERINQEIDSLFEELPF